ncbi:MAG: hypothetical protein SA339_01990 [Methanomassiliicoccus sp.]|nr:hypothetical protein [Methanomassiliicoccus sp.]
MRSKSEADMIKRLMLEAFERGQRARLTADPVPIFEDWYEARCKALPPELRRESI